MTFRATLRAKRLPTNARGIGPDEFKDKVNQRIGNGELPSKASKIVAAELYAQEVINNKFNTIAIELGDELISKLKDVDITWCKDGCIVISGNNTIAEVERVMDELNLEIVPDRPDIKHKVKKVDPQNENSASEEDIDEVFEPKTPTATKTLRSNPRVNKYQRDRVVQP